MCALLYQLGNYGAQIRTQLKKIRRGSAGYITSFHDPFNPLEDVYHNSQQCAEEFVAVGLPVFFLSRLVYPDWAVDLLAQNPYSYAQKSMNTSSEVDWKKMSPRAASLQEHYDDIRRLKDRGIYVSIQVNPVIPGVTNHADINRLFRRLSKAGADHVIVKFVEAAYSWVPALVKRVKARFSDRGDAFERLFTQNIGGEKAVDEAYRLAAHRHYRRWARAYGLTYSVCYEYRYDRDDQGEIVNKTGISLGPEVTSSDQCHGQRVPMFTRQSADDMFQEVKECPPSGCLYCAERYDNGVPCCDEMASHAIALRMKHLKEPIGDA
jgi:DNA repair photolyase